MDTALIEKLSDEILDQVRVPGTGRLPSAIKMSRNCYLKLKQQSLGTYIYHINNDGKESFLGVPVIINNDATEEYELVCAASETREALHPAEELDKQGITGQLKEKLLRMRK